MQARGGQGHGWGDPRPLCVPAGVSARQDPPHNQAPWAGSGPTLPSTLFRGSLMLTVWSWEADSEVLMERSVGEENVRQAGGRLEQPSAVPRCPPQPVLSPRELPASGLCSEPPPKRKEGCGHSAWCSPRSTSSPCCLGTPGMRRRLRGSATIPLCPGTCPHTPAPGVTEQPGGGPRISGCVTGPRSCTSRIHSESDQVQRQPRGASVSEAPRV